MPVNLLNCRSRGGTALLSGSLSEVPSHQPPPLLFAFKAFPGRTLVHFEEHDHHSGNASLLRFARGPASCRSERTRLCQGERNRRFENVELRTSILAELIQRSVGGHLPVRASLIFQLHFFVVHIVIINFLP